MHNKKRKICFICSSGGHFSELYNLKDVSKEFDSFLIVEKIDRFQTDFSNKVYYISEMNRTEKLFIFKFLYTCIREFFLFLKEKPDYIVTTGALCAYPICKIGHFFKKKIIYIESYARIKDLSKTGKRVYKFADLFFVQWKELQKKYPKSIYCGSFFGGE